MAGEKAETPSEYDRRKVAELEFLIPCAYDTCSKPASVALRCRGCGEVNAMHCLEHARLISRAVTEIMHRPCGTIGRAAALFASVELGEWFPWAR